MRTKLCSIFFTAVFAAPAAATFVVPDAFLQASVSRQNRVCGEVLSEFSLIGAQSAAEKKPGAAKSSESRTALRVGTYAVAFLKATGSMTTDEKKKAGLISAAINKSDMSSRVATALTCRGRMEQWLAEGLVSEAELQAYEAQVQELITKAITQGQH